VLVEIDLDGSARSRSTPRAVLRPHADRLFGVHGSFDLVVRATGDVHIDAHHTVEDVAIVLRPGDPPGMGDKAGIRRFGDCWIPMTRPWPTPRRRQRRPY